MFAEKLATIGRIALLQFSNCILIDKTADSLSLNRENVLETLTFSEKSEEYENFSELFGGCPHLSPRHKGYRSYIAQERIHL